MVSETMERAQGGVKKVLILVVVEDGLGELFGFSVSSKQYEVLILVVVEDGLGDYGARSRWSEESLNPCCSGRWSRRGKIVDACELARYARIFTQINISSEKFCT
jgi:hypothetical protein